MKQKVSTETQDKAMQVAKGIQKKGQTKEQTKLIAQGIEKGIAEYKKQQNAKARARDKLKKQKAKEKTHIATENEPELFELKNSNNSLPWILLGGSWIGFAFIYLYF